MVSQHRPELPPAAEQRRPLQLVGHRVRRLRKARRLSLGELAVASGVQATDLARLEKGEYRASLDVLFRILGALEVEGEAFLAQITKESATVPNGDAIREL